MVNVFDYEDYHLYLRDYFNEKKKHNPGFSYNVFSQKAGLNRTFIHAVVSEKKNLGIFDFGF